MKHANVIAARFGIWLFPLLSMLAGCGGASTTVTPARSEVKDRFDVDINQPSAAPKEGKSGAAVPPIFQAIALASMGTLDEPGPVTIKHGDVTITTPGNARVKVTQDRSATGVGSGLDTQSEKVGENWKHAAPTAQVPGGPAASGGALAFAAQMTGSSSDGLVLFVLGGLMIAGAGAAMIWGGGPRMAMGLGAAGLALIACGVVVDKYPWVFAVGLLVLLALGVWWLLDRRRATQATTAFHVVRQAISKAEDPIKEAIKKKIAETAGPHEPLVRAQVDASKGSA